jgi:hypothetical protein
MTEENKAGLFIGIGGIFGSGIIAHSLFLSIIQSKIEPRLLIAFIIVFIASVLMIRQSLKGN